MKKVLKVLLLLSLIFNFFSMIPNVYAEYNATVIDSEGLHVRSGPGTNYSSITVLKLGSIVTLVSDTKHSGTGCNGWYQINYEGNTNRYICSEFVSVNQDNGNTTIKGDYYTSTVWGMRISEDYAYIRTSPNMNLAKSDTVWLGTTVKVLAENAATSGCSEGWYKVSYYNDTKNGWICKRFVDKYENITATDATIENNLKAAGFPDSYIPFLVYLQKKHPTWVFKALKTNKDFNTAVNKEEGKNYTQSTVSQYRLNNTLKENPNWYAASNPYLAYMLDPRNYLTERNIFVFENLGFDIDHHTSSVVKALFSGTYLEADNYVSYFMNAATDYKVSPVHLASRVKQEGGTVESYAGVSGVSTSTYDGKSLKNCYNYYNIGAYQDAKTSSPVTRGLAVACGYIDNYYGTPWNTREKAIVYGARFIANSYINVGQNTLYFQKFNTGPSAANPYTHQYMTNILAPASESLTIFSSYKDMKMLETPFVFAIPIYNNMPDEFTVHPLVGNTNHNLASITINNNSINGFDKDVLSYTHYIAKNTTSVVVNATPEVSTTTISGLGNINTPTDTTTVKIVVTSQVGTSKTYNISLVKTEVEPDTEMTVADILSKVDIKLSGSYMSGITVGTSTTTLANSINKIAPTAKVSITDANAKATNGTLATGYIITIENGTDKKTYTIVIKGDNNGDGLVNITDLLRVQKHILGSSKLTGMYYEACDTNYDGLVNITDLLRVQKHILKDIVLK